MQPTVLCLFVSNHGWRNCSWFDVPQRTESNYKLKFKIATINYTEIHGNLAAKRKFGIDQTRIMESKKTRNHNQWSNQGEYISTVGISSVKNLNMY